LYFVSLLLTASGYVPGGSGTTIHSAIQYNKIKYTKTQNNTYTLKRIHNTKITNIMHKRKQEYKVI
jgi:hypothetical protein